MICGWKIACFNSDSSLSILDVIGKTPEALVIELLFYLPDFKVDFFLSDFCLLGLAPLP